MLFVDSYLTIENSCEAIYKVKGSKFLAFAFPVTSESEIKLHLNKLKKEHPGANHHCYAWQLGATKPSFRASDDGEPSNTAGKPILTQLQTRQLTNVLVVVVRYFGGTLLGVGGLISAYKSSAEEVLAKASLVEKPICLEYSVEFDFDDLSQVMRTLKEIEAQIVSTSYEETNSIIFIVKRQNLEKLETKFEALYKTKLKFITQV